MDTHQKRLTFSVGDILNALRENRAKHLEEFKSARASFLKAVARALELKVARVRELNLEDPNTRLPRELTYFSLNAPVNRVAMYDELIALFEHTTDDEITLSFDEHKNIFLDDWTWRQQALCINSVYIPGGPEGPEGLTGETGPTGDPGVPGDIFEGEGYRPNPDDSDLRTALDEILGQQ